MPVNEVYRYLISYYPPFMEPYCNYMIEIIFLFFLQNLTFYYSKDHEPTELYIP